MRRSGSVLDSIGNNPAVPLVRIAPPESAEVHVLLEYLNPSGSVKDRIAAYMVQRAEERGDLRPGDRIVEATSGNTGIAFALVGRLRATP